MSVKTYQHGKAIGNARATVRAAMHVILRDLSGQDVVGGVDTPYGPERTTAAATITCNPATGENIIAMGRLERHEVDASEVDARLAHKETYTLYWLPYDWNDYQGNPQAIGNEVNTADAQSVGFLTQGTRIWIVLDTDDLQAINGREAWEFIVTESRRQGPGDVVEFEALVTRSEGRTPRTVVAP